MKKLLVLMLVVTSLLTACEKKEKEEKPESSPNTTSNYTVNFETVCNTENLDKISAYIKTTQPDVSEDTLKSDLTTMSNYIKASNNLKLDLKDDYKKILNLMGGDAAIENAKKQNVDTSYIDFVLAYQTCESAIINHMKENGLWLDANKYFMDNYWRAKHVLIATDGKTDEEKADAKSKAEDILKRAESGEDFSKLVEEYSEDPGSKSSPDGYVFTTGKMVKEFEDGTKNTEIGKFTMVETSYGYHVIQRLAIDETPELYETFYNQCNQEDRFEDLVNYDNVLEFVNKNAQ